MADQSMQAITMTLVVKQADVLRGHLSIAALPDGGEHPGQRLVDVVRKLYPDATVEVELCAFCPMCGRPSRIQNARIEPHQIPGSQRWCRASAELLETIGLAGSEVAAR